MVTVLSQYAVVEEKGVKLFLFLPFLSAHLCDEHMQLSLESSRHQEAPRKKPQKPLSGKLLLRVPPEVHAGALVEAEVAGKSLNQWATEVLAKAIRAA